MQTFKITRELEIVCDWVKTRSAFKHTAVLLRNGSEIYSTKICYLNRTWEAYEFESILEKVLDQNKDDLSKYELSQFRKMLKNGGKKEKARVDSQMRTVGIVAMMGDLLLPKDDQKGRNDWKARMLKAGLGNSGLSMPDDWDTLSEDEKQRRLDGVIGVAMGKED